MKCTEVHGTALPNLTTPLLPAPQGQLGKHKRNCRDSLGDHVVLWKLQTNKYLGTSLLAALCVMHPTVKEQGQTLPSKKDEYRHTGMPYRSLI